MPKPKEEKRQETMSPPERMEALMKKKPIDRVPFISFASGLCAASTGLDVKDIYEDAEKSFWAQMWAQEIYGWDGAPLYSYASFGGWEFGGEIKMPRGEWEQAPVVTRFPVTAPEDVDALKVPDVETAGCYPIHIEFSKIQKKLGMPITVSGIAPFTAAGNICEVDNLCRWIIKKPDVAHKLIGKTLEFHKKVIDYFVNKFPNYPMMCFMGEPSAANQVISPKHFREFALPYIKEATQYTLDRGLNIFFHLCGEQNMNLPAWTEVNFGDPGICSFGQEVNLSKAIEMFGDKNIIAGNVEPAIIQMGTGQQVYELSKACIEKAKHAPSGFILMPGCECPVYAPPYNVYSMKKAVMDFGFYD
jgi:uroporphyrinogen decarboxylase